MPTSILISPAALTVNITVSYTPPPGFTPGPNEYREASGPVVVTCTATGGAGHEDYLYEWTSTCANCEFQMSSLSGETIIINQTAVHSDDTGTHTCTASRGGESESDSIVFIVVGKWLMLHMYTRTMWILVKKQVSEIPQHCGELCN